MRERFIGTLRREYLDQLLITGPCHLTLVLQEYIEHHNAPRPHRSLRQQPPTGATPHRPVLHSGRYDGIDSAASCTSTCRSHDVSVFSAPTPAAP